MYSAQLFTRGSTEEMGGIFLLPMQIVEIP